MQKFVGFQCVKKFFILAYELDVAISFWKYYNTPKFQELMSIFDQMTKAIMYYVDRAAKRLDSRNLSESEGEADRSVLEKLLSIDRRIALIMAYDCLLAGVDTVNCHTSISNENFIYLNICFADISWTGQLFVSFGEKSRETGQIARGSVEALANKGKPFEFRQFEF